MRAEHIYISKDGIPMAPTKEVPTVRLGPKTYLKAMAECKRTSIPIREEDYKLAIDLVDAVCVGPSITKDTFYHVEPYEFVEGWCDDHGCAYIVKYSEPKANPSKELYIPILEFDTSAVSSEGSEVVGANFAFGFYSVTRDGKTGKYFWTMNDFKKYPCTDFDDGKRQAQTHFESKLKQMLNREI